MLCPFQPPTPREHRSQCRDAAKHGTSGKRHANATIVYLPCCELDLRVEVVDCTDGVADLINYLFSRRENGW